MAFKIELLEFKFNFSKLSIKTIFKSLLYVDLLKNFRRFLVCSILISLSPIFVSIKKKLGEMNTVLIALIDRVRMLDNDIIRLRSKVNTVLELREKQKKKSSK